MESAQSQRLPEAILTYLPSGLKTPLPHHCQRKGEEQERRGEYRREEERRGPNLVLCRYPSCQSGVKDVPEVWVT